jgi:acetoin utilization deacetylase AcuC-like enzyme
MSEPATIHVITDQRCTEYSAPGHPECPERILRTVERMRRQSELRVEWLNPQPVDDKVLLRAHSRTHLKRLEKEVDFDLDTPAPEGIADHARRGVGGGLRALRGALRRKASFSLLRPPGHHATRDDAMGFCYLSNIAITSLAARAAGVERVAIFDFDVHHGNGTEDILVGEPGITFHSIHQFPAFPGTGRQHRGDNCFNYSVPPGLPAADYRGVATQVLEKLMAQKPDLLAVSAGFDAYARDPLCQQRLEAEDFHWLGKTLSDLDLPMFSLLEGGYSDDLPELILAYLRGVAGLPLQETAPAVTASEADGADEELLGGSAQAGSGDNAPQVQSSQSSAPGSPSDGDWNTGSSSEPERVD